MMLVICYFMNRMSQPQEKLQVKTTDTVDRLSTQQ